MSNQISSEKPRPKSQRTDPLTPEQRRKILKRRRRAEARFRAYGFSAIGLSLLLLATLLTSIISNGYSAFQETYLKLEIFLDPAELPKDNLQAANYLGLVKDSIRNLFPEVTGRSAKRQLTDLVSPGTAFQLRDMVLHDPSLIGKTFSLWTPADDDVDMWMKGNIVQNPENGAPSRLSDNQFAWLEKLKADGRLELQFNKIFFTAGDSREPELAGIWGAVCGSFYTLLVTLLLSFPIGVAAAIYLEEFAPTNKWTDIIEVNINNLAAVPSIVFGLLGLAVFLNFFGLPRSAPLVGGLVLTLMTLPTIIISSRAAIKAVPPSIREAALGIGSSKMQAVLNHVLPLALPGILTGTIIGMAQALGETAPLLMIGMVAFIVDIPQGLTDPSTVLPVQIYLWSDSPERAFMERTSAAIIVLLGFLIIMNAIAIILRKRFERQW